MNNANDLHNPCPQASPDLRQSPRAQSLFQVFRQTFGQAEGVRLFSGPGRVELGGNHTDHQHGCVLAAAVDLDTLAWAAPTDDGWMRICSQGYPEIRVQTSDLTPRPEERGSSAALVRGVAAAIRQLGFPVGGFCACAVSAVPAGAGMSSSASFEILLGAILNTFFCGGSLSPLQLAQAGQQAENTFFGKPCGLMDQLACSVGGAIAVDFQDSAHPAVRQIRCDPEAAGYALCIVNSGGSHADLTAEYAAIPAEMGQIAAYFGKSVLREIPEDAFWRELPALRQTAGDRAVLRAVHFFTDNRLAQQEAQALEAGDFPRFLTLVSRSGASSAQCLQNLSCAARPAEQALPVSLALAQHLLAGQGAVRVHGGGFAGTIQAYVPLERRAAFQQGMEAALGAGCCHFVKIRPAGGMVL